MTPRTDIPRLDLTFDGRPVSAHPGQTVGAALVDAGIRSWRTTRMAGRPRGLFCGIGVCFDCLITADGVPNQRACLLPARDGMVLTSGARPALDPTFVAPTGARSGAAIDPVDIAVVGAGPAGLAAATAAAEHGRRTAVIDAGGQLGGQYWRHPDEDHPRGPEDAGHHDWRTFTRLRDRFRRAQRDGLITYLPHSQVWFLEELEQSGWRLHLTSSAGPEAADAVGTVGADRLILCPGGYDRQLPIPGWDLIGVLAAGGVQSLLKGHRSLAGCRAVVAGTGPFLLPVARQLGDAGADVVAVCEAARPTSWLRHLQAVAGVPGKAVEGAGYAAALARRRTPYRSRTVVARILPDPSGNQVRAVELARVNGTGTITRSLGEVPVDLVALGWGFTPALELPMAVGADTRLDVDGSLVVVVDDRQRTSVPGVYAAGEATGVGGATLAVLEGEVAGHAAAAADGPSARARRRIARHRRFAAAMHTAHPIPADWTNWLDDDTTVCRCEEVGYGRVRAVRDDLGARDLRSVKLLARPGMGWCQGAVCSAATARIAAAAEGRNVTADDLRSGAKRPFCVPVELGTLAGSDGTVRQD